jgi:hypothetical protein
MHVAIFTKVIECRLRNLYVGDALNKCWLDFLTVVYIKDPINALPCANFAIKAKTKEGEEKEDRLLNSNKYNNNFKYKYIREIQKRYSIYYIYFTVLQLNRKKQKESSLRCVLVCLCIYKRLEKKRKLCNMSQYFKARRKRGACYGTLWKQHSSNSTPPDLYSFKDEAELKAEAVAKANKSSMNIGALSASGSGPFRMNGNKKEAKIRNDYLTMTNGGSSSGKKISVTVTSSSTSSKKNIAGVETLTAALEKNERAKCYEFCVLIGNTLTCYENLTAFRRGDHPSVS